MNPDPLFDALKRDVRTYHRALQNRLMQRLKYDVMRYEAIDSYMDARRRAIHRSAKISARALDATLDSATMRARLVLDEAYDEIVRDVSDLRQEIQDLAETNRQALDALRALEEEQHLEQRPGYYDSFDLFH